MSVINKPYPQLAIREGLVRTYGDLIVHTRHSNYTGNCCSCHDFRAEGPFWQLSTRANICKQCCERKKDQVLGSIARAEQSARRYAKLIATGARQPNTKFYASLAGVSVAFMEKAIDTAFAKVNAAIKVPR